MIKKRQMARTCLPLTSCKRLENSVVSDKQASKKRPHDPSTGKEQLNIWKRAATYQGEDGEDDTPRQS